MHGKTTEHLGVVPRQLAPALGRVQQVIEARAQPGALGSALPFSLDPLSAQRIPAPLLERAHALRRALG